MDYEKTRERTDTRKIAESFPDQVCRGCLPHQRCVDHSPSSFLMLSAAVFANPKESAAAVSLCGCLPACLFSKIRQLQDSNMLSHTTATYSADTSGPSFGCRAQRSKCNATAPPPFRFVSSSGANKGANYQSCRTMKRCDGTRTGSILYGRLRGQEGLLKPVMLEMRHEL